MFLRLLFVLLVALDIAVGAWLMLGQPYPHHGDAVDPGVTELHLLSEMPASASTATVAPSPSASAATSASYRCMTLGPFATPQDLHSARQSLATQTIRTRSRQEQTTQSNGWWVYLPAAGTHAQALVQARALGARHISDYLVITGGDQSNMISLGLFKDPDNARKRRDDIVAAGFPAQMSERNQNIPEYWLDLVVADSGFDWRSRVHIDGVGSHSSGCF
jgi:hypothetical protein